MLSYGHTTAQKGALIVNLSRNNGYNTFRNTNKRTNKSSHFTTLSMDSESFIYSVVMEIQQGD